MQQLTVGVVALLVASGIATGVLGALLGTGGGVFLIPILVLGLGMPIHFAVATSIVTVVATSCAVASANVERGTANMRLGMTLEIATALGAIAGGLTAHWFSERALEALFALILIPTGILMWRGRTGHNQAGATVLIDPPPTDEELGALGARYFDDVLGREVAYQVRRPWAGLAVSFVAGNLSGLLGIGGGVFKVPALHLLCEVPIKAAAATSNFMIGVTAAASASIYYSRGEVRAGRTAAVVLGVLLGSILGSLLNRRVGGTAVRRLFAGLLILVAVQMLYRAMTRGGTP